MTSSAGNRSQGWSATDSTFCAPCSSTPQLTAGGRSPTPRKLSAVSPRIIEGMRLEALTIRWLANAGSMCRNNWRRSGAPSSLAASTYSSSRSARNLLRTVRASPVQPRMDRTTVIAK